MATASLFTNGKSQAVRIPKELEFEGIYEVEVTRDRWRLNSVDA
jgi:antitoxin VapB